MDYRMMASKIVPPPDWLMTLNRAKDTKKSKIKATKKLPMSSVDTPPNEGASTKKPKSASSGKASASLEAILEEMRDAEKGKRNATLYRLSARLGRLIAAGVLPESATAELVEAAEGTGLPPDEVAKTSKSGFDAGLSSSAFPGTITEDRCAVEFVARYGANTRYCNKVWYECCPATQIWEPDKTPSVFNKIRHLSRSLNTEGTMTLGKSSHYRGVATIAQNDPQIFTKPDQWDAHPMLLGTPDGIVRLDHDLIVDVPDRELYVSKKTSVPPAEGAPVVWEAFNDQITQGDKGLARYIKQIAGYSLTGSTKAQEFFFIYGPGGNGKGVWLNTIANVMGDYAKQATMDVLMASKQDRHSTDIAMLAGSRLVAASETEDGRSWKESLLKALTGGDKITARKLYQDNTTFSVTFKIIVISNYKPKLSNVNDAMRRRLNVIPFSFKPTKPDLDLEKKLEAEYPQILNWMIEGCRDWLANGFVKPQCVLDETDQYFEEQDLTAQWIGEKCDLSKDLKEQGNALLLSWKRYCIGKGEPEHCLSPVKFGNEMSRIGHLHGITKKHKTSGSVYSGVALKDDGDMPPLEMPDLFQGELVQ